MTILDRLRPNWYTRCIRPNTKEADVSPCCKTKAIYFIKQMKIYNSILYDLHDVEKRILSLEYSEIKIVIKYNEHLF